LIRGAIAGIGLILLFGPGASAQEPSPPPQRAGQAGVTIEEVIVTGSNIPTSEEVGPNPVLMINRDLIEKSGERTTEESFRM
jgi:hypothetical protein